MRSPVSRTWSVVIVIRVNHNDFRGVTEETHFTTGVVGSFKLRLNFHGGSSTLDFLRNCEALGEEKRFREDCDLTIVKDSVFQFLAGNIFCTDFRNFSEGRSGDNKSEGGEK